MRWRELFRHHRDEVSFTPEGSWKRPRLIEPDPHPRPAAPTPKRVEDVERVPLMGGPGDDLAFEQAVNEAAAGWRFLAREWQAKADEYLHERNAAQATVERCLAELADERRARMSLAAQGVNMAAAVERLERRISDLLADRDVAERQIAQLHKAIEDRG